MIRKKIEVVLKVLLCSILIFVMLFASACDNAQNNTDDDATNKKPPIPVEKIVFNDELPRVQANENLHFTMETVDEGFNVYAPVEGTSWGYRYGPSIMYYPDGSVDAWFATPGVHGEWDWFTYRHSDDGGKTWTNEKVVLQPTADSMDHYSVCDPAVIYFGGYYYLGYTSTIVSTGGGVNNNGFVARSTHPDGPFEKWNGSGWGGDPAPIVYYDEDDSKWGAGELSFVELDGKLYIYYTWTCPEGNFTMVSTADATNENWPSTMKFEGQAYKKAADQDSCDVVYVEDYGKFLAFSTIERMTANSGIAIFESNDGISFEKVGIIKTGIAQYCHNMGISKRSNGHIQMDDDICFIGYAFSSGPDSWGNWPTKFQNIKLTTYEGKIQNTDKNGKGTLNTNYNVPKYTDDQLWTVAIGIKTNKDDIKSRVIEFFIDEKQKDVPLFWYDTCLKPHSITSADGVKFSNYDKNIISFDGLKVKAKKVGKTSVTVSYDGCSVEFKVYVRDSSFPKDKMNPEISVFKPVQEEITIYKGKAFGAYHKKQVRGYVVFETENWGEAYNDKSKDHPTYPAKIPAEKYLMKFESADENIVRVNDVGILTPRNVGSTTVTVKLNDLSFTVKVNVVDVPDDVNSDLVW